MIPWGILSWISAALAVVLIGRIAPWGREPRALSELLLAIASSTLAGLLATWLDFGGWAVVDWRSTSFAVTVALTTIALNRLRRLRVVPSGGG